MNAIHPNVAKWQERDRKRDEARAKFPLLVAAIVKALPGHPWFVERRGEHNDHCLVAQRHDRLEIIFYLNDYEGRVVVTPKPPAYQSCSTLRNWGVIKHDEPNIECTVSIDRNPVHAAGQIMRDVIGPYAPLFPQIVERKEKAIGQTNAAIDLTAELCRTLGEHPEKALEAIARGDRGTVHCRTQHRSVSFHVAASGGYVDLDRFSMGPSTARAFAQWLASRNAPLSS